MDTVHSHNWLQSDAPGIYTCGFDCGFGVLNQETNEIEQQ
jgi:hypothetical protein